MEIVGPTRKRQVTWDVLPVTCTFFLIFTQNITSRYNHYSQSSPSTISNTNMDGSGWSVRNQYMHMTCFQSCSVSSIYMVQSRWFSSCISVSSRISPLHYVCVISKQKWQLKPGGLLEHYWASMSKQCTVALNCYAAKALPVKYQVTAHRPTVYKSS